MLYAAGQRRACFVETLAPFRPSLEVLAKLQALPDGDVDDNAPDEFRRMPDDWHLKRMLGSFRVVPNQRWLDIRSLDDREHLQRELARSLVELGRDDFDMSDALGRNRDLTRAISRWAFEQGYQGIVYSRRLEAAFDCWALFEGGEFEILDTS